jgi:hypothetical protein
MTTTRYNGAVYEYFLFFFQSSSPCHLPCILNVANSRKWVAVVLMESSSRVAIHHDAYTPPSDHLIGVSQAAAVDYIRSLDGWSTGTVVPLLSIVAPP